MKVKGVVIRYKGGIGITNYLEFLLYWFFWEKILDFFFGIKNKVGREVGGS